MICVLVYILVNTSSFSLQWVILDNDQWYHLFYYSIPYDDITLLLLYEIGIFDRIVERAQDRSSEGSDTPPPSGGIQQVITLYRNGFIVDGGPFRDITAPENRAFIQSLEQGNVPAGERRREFVSNGVYLIIRKLSKM